MKLTYKLSEEDYMKYVLYDARSSNQEEKMLKILRKFIFLILLAMALVTCIAMMVSSNVLVWTCLVAIAFLLILGIFYYPEYIRKRIKSKASKIIKEAVDNNLLKYENELEMNEKGIVCSDDVSTTFVKWICVTKISFNSRYVCVRTNSRTFIIPVCKTEHSMKEIVEHIKIFIPNEALYTRLDE